MEKDVKGNIAKLYLIGITNSLQFFSAVLVPFFTEWGQILFAQVMILESIFTGAIFIMEIPSGTFADYFGRKKTLIIGYVSLVIAILVYGSVPNFWVFALGEIIWAVASACQSGTYEAMIYETLKQEKREDQSKVVFGRLGSVQMIGLAVAAPIGSLIAQYISLQATMLFCALPASVTIMISLTLKEPFTEDHHRKLTGSQILHESIQMFHEKRELRALTADSVIMSIGPYFMIWLYQVRLAQIGVQVVYFGLVQMTIVIVEAIILNMFVLFEKVFGSKLGVIKGFSILIGFGYILVVISNSAIIVILGIVLTAGIGFSRKTLIMNYLNKYTPDEKRATMLSFVSMLGSLVTMILNPLVGYIADISMEDLCLTIGGILLLWAILSPIRKEYLLN